MQKCLKAADYVVAILPETFINSNFEYFSRAKSITVIEKNLFYNTETPVCVVCFDNRMKGFDQIEMYKGDKYVATYSELLSIHPYPQGKYKIDFNNINGQIGLIAFDSTTPHNRIRFVSGQKINKNNIKHTSRAITLIKINKKYNNDIKFIINQANTILKELRDKTEDLTLSPFKGNQRNGKRRRRLDFRTARAIIEQAIDKIDENKIICGDALEVLKTLDDESINCCVTSPPY